MEPLNTLLNQIKIDHIHTEPIQILESFLDAASRFAHMPGTVILMSGGNQDCSEYHILGIKPWLIFQGKGQEMSVTVMDTTHRFTANPFETLRSIITHYQMNDPNLAGPIASGLFGYLAYDLKDHLEALPRTSIDDQALPDIYLAAPSIIMVHRKEDDASWISIPCRSYSGETLLETDLEYFKTKLLASPPKMKSFSGSASGTKSKFDRSSYMDAVNQIIEYIKAGHVYQVNMSQRFEMECEGDPFDLFQTLYQNNPAPFFSYINEGNHQIVSTSPERFIKQTDQHLETRPIKGTRPRGKTDIEDRKFRTELMESKKDDAELSMIVDLLRNDIGKVCEGGSVRVTQHKRLEAYQNVYHLVSVVEGQLKNHIDSVDVIQAVFPGGSITGCPKIRSMEIIDELEPNRRHIYTGSIGYISFHKTMDLSIAIRTATVHEGNILFSVGGGIVYDSDPGLEYEETLHKGRTLSSALLDNKGQDKPESYVWMDGLIRPLKEACIPIDDMGFLYGYGFFETIRVSHGQIDYLDQHLKRFNHSWSQLFQDAPQDLSWDVIIDQVLKANHTEHETTAVKIIATMGPLPPSRQNHSLIVMSRPYEHRLKDKDPYGIDLVIYPEQRHTHLADHKSLNYLFYHLAGIWAKNQAADEALILNTDGSVSETNTANIFLINDKEMIRPESPHVLPGIMEQAVTHLLSTWNYSSQTQPIHPEDLFSADLVLLTNSLIGAVPVLSLDGKKLKPPSDLWIKINKKVLRNNKIYLKQSRA